MIDCNLVIALIVVHEALQFFTKLVNLLFLLGHGGIITDLMVSASSFYPFYPFILFHNSLILNELRGRAPPRAVTH